MCAMLSTLSKYSRRIRPNVYTKSFSSSADAISNTDKQDKPNYDIVIVGGGIVGSALACQLKTNPIFKGIRVALIEAERPFSERYIQKHGEKLPDLRAYTITPASQALFTEMKVWDKIPQNQMQSFSNMQVWDAMGDGYIRFDGKKAGYKALGHVVENQVLATAIQERLAELTHVTDDKTPLKIYCPRKMKSYHRPNASMYLSELVLDNGDRMTAELVVAADGGNSVLRNLSGLGTWGWEYDQHAVVATVKTDAPSHNTAWQRFFPTGPIALLPLRDGYSSIVYSCSAEMAEELTSSSLSAEDLVDKLNDALHSSVHNTNVSPNFPGIPIFSDVVKGVEHSVNTVLAAASLTDPFQSPPKITSVVGPRVKFPLKMQHATTYIKEGLALIGDSAHTIHPLAGQGLNLGLMDVKSLAKVLEVGILSGEYIGSKEFLQEYEDDRKKANVTMAVAMDGFKRLFGPTPDPVGLLRNVGMGSLNAVEPVKHVIMRYAMGL